MHKPSESTEGTPLQLLVLRALGLGDLLVAIPALRALKRHFPAHLLVVAAPGWLRSLLDIIDVVDQHVPVAGLAKTELAALEGFRQPDVAVNLHGNGVQSRDALLALKPSRYLGHAVPDLGNFRQAGGPATGGPPWRDGIHERVRWVLMLQWYGIGGDPDDFRLPRPAAPEGSTSPAGASVLHVGAAFGSRLWPVDRFAAVARELTRRGHHVVLTGDSSDIGRAAQVAELAGLETGHVLAGRQDLGAFIATVANARLLVSGDTGAAHLASAFATPSAVIFGPVAPSQWGPPDSGPHVVLTDAGRRRGDPFADSADPALLAITHPDVLEALVRLGVA